MALSAEKKRTLKELYETWGIDRVRKDLERHQYPSLLSADISAFERDWVKAKEAKDKRKQQFLVILKIFFFSLFAGTVVALFAR